MGVPRIVDPVIVPRVIDAVRVRWVGDAVAVSRIIHPVIVPRHLCDRQRVHLHPTSRTKLGTVDTACSRRQATSRSASHIVFTSSRAATDIWNSWIPACVLSMRETIGNQLCAQSRRDGIAVHQRLPVAHQPLGARRGRKGIVKDDTSEFVP